MTNLRVWLSADDVAHYIENKAISPNDEFILVSAYPLQESDLCYELVAVSREQLAKEADEGIKQIDKEMK